MERKSIDPIVCLSKDRKFVPIGINASQDAWFNLDLVNYQAQLVNGSTRMTPQAGIKSFMPDADEKAPQKASQAITLEWLRDRNRSLPPDVSVK